MKKNSLKRIWQKTSNVLLSHYVISLIVTLPIIILFFPTVTKYKITINKTHKSIVRLNTYADMTGDGISDLIAIANDTSNYYSLVVLENPSLQTNQWNFDGKLITYTNDYMIIGDFDTNHKKEIYLFSLISDSIFLQCISDIKNNVPYFKNEFIVKVGLGKDNYDPAILKAEMDDLNDDGYKELIFAVNSGFSLSPRNIFAYDLHNKKCISSPYLGLTVDKILQKDITGDGKNEILIQGHGPDNITDTTIQYHDRSTWLMVLDRNLNYLFEPIEFKGAFSHIYPFVFEHNKQLNQAGFYLRTTSTPSHSELCLFTKHGEITKTLNMQAIAPNGIYNPFTISANGENLLVLSEYNKNERLLVNEQFEVQAKTKIIALEFPPVWFDLDSDGQNEMISIDLLKGKLVIARSNLKHQVNIDINVGSGVEPVFSLKKNGKEMPELVIWDRSSLMFLCYQFNPLFYLKWLIYLGIYLSILLFTWMIRRIQRYQIARNREIEKKMTELQMKIVKNQLDPHFTLNAVNSIIYAVGNNEPERATEHLYHFSNLYRHLLHTADKYKCSLKDELSFTIDYLKMEQLRYRDKYKFAIVIDDSINQDIEIPKMCIQTAVENAIKHGISQMKAGGEILISAKIAQNQLVIEIKDNGIGRAAAKNSQLLSTHMGVELTRQYFELFSKITKRQVQSEITDLTDDSGNTAGTKVRISVQLN